MIAMETKPLIEMEPPPTGPMVMVECDGFCCLAYRNQDGNRMTAFTHEEINHFTRILQD